MIGYYLRLAVKSVMRTPALSAFTVLGIGIGVAVPTAMISIHHAFARNPIPHKSDVLFNVRVDSWDPNSEFFDVPPGDPPKHITYRDMKGLMASDVPRYETGIASGRIFVFPEDESLQPYRGMVRLCSADFFPMFDVPFAYGGPWSREVDTSLEHVVVLSKGRPDNNGYQPSNKVLVFFALATWSGVATKMGMGHSLFNILFTMFKNNLSEKSE